MLTQINRGLLRPYSPQTATLRDDYDIKIVTNSTYIAFGQLAISIRSD
jgi:hypothetical protein